MPRPIWSGAISFGLVTIPVKLYNAVSKKSVSFNQLDDRTGSRIKLKKVSALDGDDVPEEHIVKGYEVSKDRYVIVDPDELEQFMPVATRQIDLEEFVDLVEIDPIYFDSPYYLAPDKIAKPYRLLAEAMAAAGKVGIGRFVMRNKQYVAAIRPVDGHLVLSTMVYADEVVAPASIDELESLGDTEISAKERKMAEALVESLAAPFEPDKYQDAYREQVLDLLARKASGEELEAPAPAASAPQVIDLMAALEASVKAAKEARGRHPTTTSHPAPAGIGAAADTDDADVVEVKPKARARARKSA
jgi:DNA end-binding protein Ku